MAYDEKLADRIRKILRRRKGITEKKMFGGIAFMLNGNMCCGVVNDDLMVRVGPEQHDKSMKQDHARLMDFTGRPMKGFLFIAPAGTRTEATLVKWVRMATSYVSSLPEK